MSLLALFLAAQVTIIANRVIRPGSIGPSGDVFIVAGQSNAVGQALTLNSAANPSAVMFKHGTTIWAHLQDPTDSIGFGSVWPIVGDLYVAARLAPVGFVTTAVNGTTSGQWLPGQLYFIQMIDLYNQSGGGNVKGVLWWQGETDALGHISQAAYHSNLVAIAGQIGTTLGVKMFVAKLQSCTGIPAGDEANINAAIVAAWSDIPNVVAGPDLSDLVSDDSFHLTSDAKVQIAATRWWTAIRTQFGW